MIRAFRHFVSQPVPLISYQESAACFIIFLVICSLSFQMSRINLDSCRFQFTDRPRQVIHAEERHTKHRSHCRAYHFRVINIHTITAQDNTRHPRCLCSTEDRSQVAGILKIIEDKHVSVSRIIPKDI